ncbi:hypothetical protein AMBR_DPAELIID_02786 [Lacticaseibacillus rhamnosus]|nr:hypothetical protein AMBR_DPAELIID_02786 [Lacticaseibacillus rhamnosus]
MRVLLKIFVEFFFFFFFQAEDGIRDQPRSRGLGDVYKRQYYMHQLWNHLDSYEVPHNC